MAHWYALNNLEYWSEKTKNNSMTDDQKTDELKSLLFGAAEVVNNDRK